MSDLLDSILDSTLDDLADMPEFKPFVAGAHKVVITFKAKEVNKKPGVEIGMKAVETVELANPDDAPLAPGAETSVLFLLRNNDGSKNEIAEGKLKEILKSLKEGLGIQGTNREIMEAANGAEVLAVTKIKKNTKNDPPTENTDIVKIAVV